MMSDAVGKAGAIEGMQASLRAIAFLSVPWSVPERVARQSFEAAAERLCGRYSPRVSLIRLDEGAEACQAWLTSLALPGLGGGYARGSGCVLWLESDHVVAWELNSQRLRSEDIIDKTDRLWPRLSS